MSEMADLAYFYPEGHAAHARRGHPESPERVESIVTALRQGGWLERCMPLPAQEVPRALLEHIHRPVYLNLLEMACRRGNGSLDADTYITSASWTLALQAAGGALAVAQSVWQNAARRGFALTRPPGHHARPGQGMGFCLLNNIALAAESVLLAGARRVAIVDLDLHHGNGTQEAFWQRDDVFYLSTHQQPLFPGSGDLEETGAGPGVGYTANFPLPPGSGDQAFQQVMDTLILPLLDRYQPEMVLVSYGFDPHWRDPLGGLLLSADVYGRLIEKLTGWTDQHSAGKIALFLEGGYDLDAAQACSLAVVAALLGEPWQDPLGPSPFPESQDWQQTVSLARQMWSL